MGQGHGRALERLVSIAAMLGITVEDLTTGSVPPGLRADDECWRLWRGLKTEAGRDAALRALRGILDQEGV